ncbi:unnamed protein product [Phaeothamnion confervicola]
MKVYLHYEEGEDTKRHMTLKLTLPRKWDGDSPVRVLELFVEAYNKRKPDTPLDLENVHMEANGVTLTKADTIGESMVDRGDVLVARGPTPEGSPKPLRACKAALTPTFTQSVGFHCRPHFPATVAGMAGDDGLSRCRNYGCNKRYAEAENSREACLHHTAPPLFHDTKKGWSCCEKRVYDWDEFQAIPGCTRGPHSTVDPKELFAASPNAVSPGEDAAAGPPAEVPVVPAVRSIEDFNTSNPDATTAAAAAVNSMAAASRRSTRRPDGTAKRVEPGCQRDFVVAENNPAACRHHTKPPVFHDTGKYWACCPGTVKYDFDDFVTIPGCTVGSHDDGEQQPAEA